MSAAFDLAGLSPELLEALAAHVAAKLAVAPPPAELREGLSMLAASIRRRACERRQADAARGDRSAIDRKGLSPIPASARRREWARRRAAAEKDPIDRSPMYLHCEAYEEHANAVPNANRGGPLASALAKIVGATDNRKRLELARVYGVIREGLAQGSKGRIALPRIWAKSASDKEDARTLLAEFGLAQIRAAAVSLGETWKPSKGFSRPTVSLILWRLQVWRAGTRPAKRADSRRMTGEAIEERARTSRAPPASPPAKKPAIWIGEKPRPGDEVRPAKEQIALILEQLEQRRGAP